MIADAKGQVPLSGGVLRSFISPGCRLSDNKNAVILIIYELSRHLFGTMIIALVSGRRESVIHKDITYTHTHTHTHKQKVISAHIHNHMHIYRPTSIQNTRFSDIFRRMTMITSEENINQNITFNAPSCFLRPALNIWLSKL